MRGNPDRWRDLWVGLISATFALFLILVAVPEGVTAPKSVHSIFLAPGFWPMVLSWALLGLGLALIAQAALALLGRQASFPSGDGDTDGRAGAFRLVGFLAILVFYALTLSILGMVWSSMIVYVTLIFLIRARQLAVGFAIAAILPLSLYMFFSRVAGVAIPQGELIRLP